MLKTKIEEHDNVKAISKSQTSLLGYFFPDPEGALSSYRQSLKPTIYKFILDIEMNELTNQLVWVHPLISDPLNRQGNFGRIAAVQPEKSHMLISFPNGQLGKYEPDTLFLLKPSVLLLEHIHGKNLANWNDHRAILDIYYLAQTGKTENVEKATEMATRNLAVADSALVSVREWLELRLARIMDEHKPSIERKR